MCVYPAFITLSRVENTDADGPLFSDWKPCTSPPDRTATRRITSRYLCPPADNLVVRRTLCF
jgi:hypothetical protein